MHFSRDFDGCNYILPMNEWNVACKLSTSRS